MKEICKFKWKGQYGKPGLGLLLPNIANLSGRWRWFLESAKVNDDDDDDNDDLEGDDDEEEDSHLSNNRLESFLHTTCHRHLGFPHNWHCHLHDLDGDLHDDLDDDDENQHLDFHDNGDWCAVSVCYLRQGNLWPLAALVCIRCAAHPNPTWISSSSSWAKSAHRLTDVLLPTALLDVQMIWLGNKLQTLPQT